jgi:hypothetical protein
VSDQETELKNVCAEILELMVAEQKRIQDACPHLQGSNPLSVLHGVHASIVWHLFNDNKIRGVCTNCLKIFEQKDPEFKHHSNNTLSAYRPLTMLEEVLEEVPLTLEVQREIDSQFCVLDVVDYIDSKETLSEFIKNELMEALKQHLFEDYMKNLRNQ